MGSPGRGGGEEWGEGGERKEGGEEGGEGVEGELNSIIIILKL